MLTKDSAKINSQTIAKGVRLILKGLGEDLQREGLLETPKRIARFYEEFFGISADIKDLRKMFGVERYDGYVLLRDIPFYSLCEHHLLPFYGHASMAYEVGHNTVLGISKCVRILELCAHRLQLQERLTEEVADALVKATNSSGVMVLLEAEHFCMQMRGVRSGHASYVTRALRGSFAADSGRLSDVLNMLQLGRAKS
jgi:GTP cyclohydrolase I